MNVSELHRLKISAERAVSLQKAWEAQRKKLLELPRKLGFNSLRDLKTALDLAFETPDLQVTRTRIGSRKKRVAITDETRKKVKHLHESGNTGSKIAKELNISPASVQNIKTQLGLVKKRKK